MPLMAVGSSIAAARQVSHSYSPMAGVASPHSSQTWSRWASIARSVDCSGVQSVGSLLAASARVARRVTALLLRLRT